MVGVYILMIFYLFAMQFLTVCLVIWNIIVSSRDIEIDYEPRFVQVPPSEPPARTPDPNSKYYMELERRKREDFNSLMNYDVDQAYKKRSDFE